MKSSTYSGIAIATLIVLALLPSTHPADAFSNNQSAVIAIGQWKSPSYSILNPAGGVTFDRSGNLWVADTYNSRVFEFTAPFSNNMSASVVIGQPDFKTMKAGVGANTVNFPEGIAFDSKGSLWVADFWSNRVLEFEPPFYNGMSAAIVIGQSDPSSSSHNLTRNGLYGPFGIIFDGAGNLWVADSGNSRVLEFQPPFKPGMNASLVIGEPDFTHNECNQASLPPSANGKCGTRTILNLPAAIAFDPFGNLWVAEGWNSGRILEFVPPFSPGMQASSLIEQIYASSIVFDSAGNLWMGVFDAGVFEVNTPFTNNLTPSLALAGYPRPANQFDGTSNEILAPYGLAFDSAGNLWVSDFRDSMLIQGVSGRVLGFNAHEHYVTTDKGTVLVENDAGLLAPFGFILTNNVPMAAAASGLTFPDGLFNFTIQGLNPAGSVTLTMRFPNPLPADTGWSSLVSGNFVRLPKDQVSVTGTNLTLTLSGASSDGVISMIGGPSLTSNLTSPATASGNTSTPSTTNVPGFPMESIASGFVAGFAVLATIRHRRHIR